MERLEDQGFVEHTWLHGQAGPGRKQFTLNEQGRNELEIGNSLAPLWPVALQGESQPSC